MTQPDRGVSSNYVQLRKIVYTGPERRSEFVFQSGVNVICGASDTGKSFLAESIDFMLGGSELRSVPELTRYGELQIDFGVNDTEEWRFHRSVQGGAFRVNKLGDLSPEGGLSQQHSHGRVDNVSGFLLQKIGLLGRRILRSKATGATQSLSFRNLARLIIVQEGEIQQQTSPFWGGQYALKTAELATVELLLSGVDHSSVVPVEQIRPDRTKEIDLIDDLLADLRSELSDIGEDKDALMDRFRRLSAAIESQKRSLDAVQTELNALLARRREMIQDRTTTQSRIDEIAGSRGAL